MGHVGPISTRSLDEILGYISPLSHMGSEGLRSLNRGILTLFGLFWAYSGASPGSPFGSYGAKYARTAMGFGGFWPGGLQKGSQNRPKIGPKWVKIGVFWAYFEPLPARF